MAVVSRVMSMAVRTTRVLPLARGMATVKFTSDHEWVKMGDDSVATVGITGYAQEQLGDIVHISLPSIGDAVEKNASFAAVESVKAASDVYSPFSGTVKAVNESLENDPEMVNRDPEGEAWFVEIDVTNPDDFEKMMTKEEYDAFCGEGHA